MLKKEFFFTKKPSVHTVALSNLGTGTHAKAASFSWTNLRLIRMKLMKASIFTTQNLSSNGKECRWPLFTEGLCLRRILFVMGNSWIVRSNCYRDNSICTSIEHVDLRVLRSSCQRVVRDHLHQSWWFSCPSDGTGFDHRWHNLRLDRQHQHFNNSWKGQHGDWRVWLHDSRLR